MCETANVDLRLLLSKLFSKGDPLIMSTSANPVLNTSKANCEVSNECASMVNSFVTLGTFDRS
jgi:hypothetical protein